MVVDFRWSRLRPLAAQPGVHRVQIRRDLSQIPPNPRGMFARGGERPTLEVLIVHPDPREQQWPVGSPASLVVLGGAFHQNG